MLALLFEKSKGNIDGVIELYKTFPLKKVQFILDYWGELTLPPESREKRMRKYADKAAQEAFEVFVNDPNKIKVSKAEGVDDKHSDLRTLDRFLSLDISPELIKHNLKH